MDDLVDQVASQPLGPKWQQLYRRLGLEPRNRYRITVEHKDKTEADKVRCCILDTIALWRKSESVIKQNEKETMKLLLSALRKVQGFEAVALELSERHGMYDFLHIWINIDLSIVHGTRQVHVQLEYTLTECKVRIEIWVAIMANH